jgi:hypothetical protein
MLIIELNEFNSDLLKSAAEQFGLNNLKKLLKLKHAQTMACEEEERYGLDPWVQWVSIHTGRPASEHQIKHLADADKIKLPQVWELVADNGISYGVWGCMNAKFNEHENCDFFFPDPWTYTEPAYPESLNNFLSLPRYYAKNYLDLKVASLLLNALKTAGYMLGNPGAVFRVSGAIFRSLFSTRLNTALLFAYFDLINASLFASMRNKKRTEFCLVFLNSMAHYQHHFWPEGNQLGPKDMRFFELIDKAIGILFASQIDDEPVIVLNSFSQENTKLKGETLYRQKNPQEMFNVLNLPEHKLEQLMTNDSQLLFANEPDCQQSASIMRSVEVDGRQAFQVEVNSKNPAALFCQFIIWDKISEDAEISSQGKPVGRFYDYFEAVTLRTGSHVQQGDIYFSGLSLPAILKNYEFTASALKYYEGAGQ